MVMNRIQLLKISAWGMSLVTCGIAAVAWLQVFGLGDLTAYQLFPLFGLLAFSLMWAHYVVGAKRRFLGVDKTALKTYFAVTGWAAILFILLHPTLLIFQLWRDGLGLPPNSYLTYVGPSLKWAVGLGTLSFLLFLAFETKRWFSKKGWWPVIEYGNVIAMFAIIVHSLALGSNLQSGWFRWVWLFYAASLALSLMYIYVKEEDRMKKLIGIVLVIALVVSAGVYAYTQMSEDESVAPETTSLEQQTLDVETADQEVYAAAEVADHNSATDCWTIIDGSVYDITSYVSRHPGGDDILAACGTDGTTLFTQRTDDSGDAVGSGTPHSSSAASQLASLKIGTVSQ